MGMDDFDSATAGSVILGIGDFVWLSHDIIVNGINGSYVIIGLLFLVGNIVLMVGLKQHHNRALRNRARRLKAKEDAKLLVNAMIDSELNSL